MKNSINNQENQPQPPTEAAPTSAALDGAPKKRNYLPWLLGILGLVVILAISFLVLTDNQKKVKKNPATINNPELIEFIRGYLKEGTETQFKIEKTEGDYAYGTGGVKDEGGFYWAAAKKDGQWNYAFGGNGIPSCTEVEVFLVGTFGGKFDECYQTQKRIINRNNSVKYSPQAKLYTSKRLGLNLYYLPERHDGVKEEGNRIYVTNGASKQFVEIFSKKKDETMIDAISRALLTKFDKEKCVVISRIEKDPTKIYDNSTPLWLMPIGKLYEIEDKTRQYADDAYYCPGDYSQANGARYFVEDENDKTKFYFYELGQYIGDWEVEQEKNMEPSTPILTTCKDESEGTPVITSLSSNSGSIGTKLEIRGCNFSGFEGDYNGWIENSQGIKGLLYGETGSTSNLLNVTLKSSLCQNDTSYSGFPCDAFLTLTPGAYKIYMTPWGKKSNEINFTIN